MESYFFLLPMATGLEVDLIVFPDFERVPSNRATGKEEAFELDRDPDPIEAPVEALIDDPVTPARNLLKFT